MTTTDWPTPAPTDLSAEEQYDRWAALDLTDRTLAEEIAYNTFAPTIEAGGEMHRLLWITDLQAFAVYDHRTGRWEIDYSQHSDLVATEILRLARQVAEVAAVDRLGAAERRVEALTDEKAKSDEADALDARANKLDRLQRTLSSMDRVRKIIAALPGVLTPDRRVTADAFDQHHELLSVSNGVVNLRTGELLVKSPHYLFTRGLDHPYNPQATAPRFEQFLEELFPTDPEMPDYIQRSLGQAITGYIEPASFTVLYSRGASGKSVLTSTIRNVFAGITEVVGAEVFEEKSAPKAGAPSPQLVPLRGARIVIATEGSSHTPLSDGLIKRTTGGDPLNARPLHKAQFTFVPSFSLFMATNHPPASLDHSHGWWRRVRYVKFPRTFAPEEQDRHLVATLTEEAEGIIAFAVQGAMAYLADGLDVPMTEQMQRDLADYKRESDPIGDFIADHLEHADGEVVALSDVHERYMAWADETGEPLKHRKTQRVLGAALNERGWNRTKYGGRNHPTIERGRYVLTDARLVDRRTTTEGVGDGGVVLPIFTRSG